MHTFSKIAQLLTVALATTLGFSFSAHTQAAASATQVIEKTRSDYAKTKYPILMVHGWLGWSRIGTDSIGLDYWYQILPDMARNGSTVLRHNCLRQIQRRIAVNNWFNRLKRFWQLPESKN